MKRVKMFHGTTIIEVLPQKVDEMISKGWALDKPSKPKPKNEVN